MSNRNAYGLHDEFREIRKYTREVRGVFNDIGGLFRTGARTTADITHVDDQVKTRGNRYESQAIRSETGINNATRSNIRSQGNVIEEGRRFDSKYGNELPAQNAFSSGTSVYYQPPQAPDLSKRDQRNFNNLLDTQAQLAALKNDAIDDEKQQIDIKKLEGDESFYRNRISDKGIAQVTQYEADNLKFQQTSANRETASARFDKNMQLAFAAPVGSEERNKALAAAFADAKELQNSQGTGVTFPNSALNYLPQPEARPEASNRRGHHTAPAPLQNPLVFGSPEAAIIAVSNNMAKNQNSGTPITSEEVKKVVLGVQNPPAKTNQQENSGAGANTGTAGNGTGTNSPTGNGAGDGPLANVLLPEADDTPAKPWGGVTIPHGLSQNQVGSVQQMLVNAGYGKDMPTKTSATGVDTMYGTRTNAALELAAKDAGVDLSKIDFASTDNPELGKLMKHLKDKAAAAKGQSTSKADETQEQKQDIAGNNPQPGEHGPNPAGNDNADITKKPAPALQTKTPTEAELKTAAGNEAAAAVAASAESRMSFLKEVATTLGFDGNGDEATLTKKYEKAIGVANPNGQLEASEVAIGEKKFEELAETRAAAYEDPFSKALADAKKYGLANGSIRHDVNADGPNGIPSVGKPTADMGRGTSVNQ